MNLLQRPIAASAQFSRDLGIIKFLEEPSADSAALGTKWMHPLK